MKSPLFVSSLPIVLVYGALPKRNSSIQFSRERLLGKGARKLACLAQREPEHGREAGKQLQRKSGSSPLAPG